MTSRQNLLHYYIFIVFFKLRLKVTSRLGTNVPTFLVCSHRGIIDKTWPLIIPLPQGGGGCRGVYWWHNTSDTNWQQVKRRLVNESLLMERHVPIQFLFFFMTLFMSSKRRPCVSDSEASPELFSGEDETKKKKVLILPSFMFMINVSFPNVLLFYWRSDSDVHRHCAD